MGHLTSPINNNLQVILHPVTKTLFFILSSLLKAAPAALGAEFPLNASFGKQDHGGNLVLLMGFSKGVCWSSRAEGCVASQYLLCLPVMPNGSV